jgi:hyperosmotically inducible protein
MQLLAVFAAGTALFASGCDQRASTEKTTSATPPATAPSTTEKMAAKTESATNKVADKMDDAAITAKVKTALMAEPGLKSLEINVDTRDNNVTLAGTVGSPDLKQKAVQIAQGVEGVKSVNDQLVVKPS